MTDCNERKLLQYSQLPEKKIPPFFDEYLLYFSVHENVHVFVSLMMWWRNTSLENEFSEGLHQAIQLRTDRLRKSNIKPLNTKINTHYIYIYIHTYIYTNTVNVRLQ